MIFIWFFFYLSDCGDLSEIQTEDSGRPTVRVKEITPSNQTSVLSNEMARAFKPYPDRSAVQVGTRAIWIACAHCLLDSLLFRRTWFWGRCWRKTKDPFQLIIRLRRNSLIQRRIFYFSPWVDRFLFLNLDLFHNKIPEKNSKLMENKFLQRLIHAAKEIFQFLCVIYVVQPR